MKLRIFSKQQSRWTLIPLLGYSISFTKLAIEFMNSIQSFMNNLLISVALFMLVVLNIDSILLSIQELKTKEINKQTIILFIFNFAAILFGLFYYKKYSIPSIIASIMIIVWNLYHTKNAAKRLSLLTQQNK